MQSGRAVFCPSAANYHPSNPCTSESCMAPVCVYFECVCMDVCMYCIYVYVLYIYCIWSCSSADQLRQTHTSFQSVAVKDCCGPLNDRCQVVRSLVRGMTSWPGGMDRGLHIPATLPPPPPLAPASPVAWPQAEAITARGAGSDRNT